jgi:hypothetical protein
MKTQIDLIKKELFFIPEVADVGSHEGYLFDDKASFGTRVGPVHSITDGLLHEIAHTAEIKDQERIFVNHFNLDIKTKIEIFGKLYCEPKTWNATKLEARVILWQEVLCEKFNLEFNREKFATSLQYMPDFMLVPIYGGYKFDGEKLEYINAKGEILTGDLKYKDSLRLKTINEYMTEQKATGLYTYNEFRKRWDSILFLIESALVK